MEKIIEMLNMLVSMSEENFNQALHAPEVKALPESGKRFFRQLILVAEMKRKEQCAV